MRSLILVAWVATRVIFLALWVFAEPIGEANVWLAKKWRQTS